MQEVVGIRWLEDLESIKELATALKNGEDIDLWFFTELLLDCNAFFDGDDVLPKEIQRSYIREMLSICLFDDHQDESKTTAIDEQTGRATKKRRKFATRKSYKRKP